MSYHHRAHSVNTQGSYKCTLFNSDDFEGGHRALIKEITNDN